MLKASLKVKRGKYTLGPDKIEQKIREHTTGGAYKQNFL